VKTNQRAAVGVAFSYALVAVAWILLSDAVVALFPAQVAGAMQTGKGLAFVAVTTLTLYLVIARYAERLGLASHQAASTERLLSQVFDTVPVGVVMTSGDGVITFMNPSAESLLGLTPAEAVGRTLEEIIFYGDRARAASFGDLLLTGAIDGIELGVDGDGPKRALIARAAAVDPAVPGSGWIVALADVTDSHHVSARLERLVRGYRYLTDAAIAMAKATSSVSLMEGQSLLAVESGGFAGAWATVLDNESDRLVDLGVRGPDGVALAPDPRRVDGLQAASADVLQRIESGEIFVINDFSRDADSPWASVAAEGGFGSAAVMAFRFGSETLATFVLFARLPGFFDADEITTLRTQRSAIAFALERLSLDLKRLQAEEALGRSERAYRQLFERQAQPMWVVDVETLAFLAANEAAVEKYGYSEDEFLGMTIADIRPPADVGRTHAMFSSLDDTSTDAGVWTHVDRSGRAFPARVYPHSVEWEGRPARVVLAIEVEAG